MYVVSKDPTTGKWFLTHQLPGWVTPVGGPYRNRKSALTVARLLAGRRGSVVIR